MSGEIDSVRLRSATMEGLYVVRLGLRTFVAEEPLPRVLVSATEQ